MNGQLSPKITEYQYKYKYMMNCLGNSPLPLCEDALHYREGPQMWRRCACGADNERTHMCEFAVKRVQNDEKTRSTPTPRWACLSMHNGCGRQQKLTVINKLTTFSLASMSLVLPRPPASCPTLLLGEQLLLVDNIGLLCGGVQRRDHHVGRKPRGVARGALHLLVGPEDGLVGRGKGRGLSNFH